VVLVHIHRLAGTEAATFDAEVGPENPAGAITASDVRAEPTAVTEGNHVALVASRLASRTDDSGVTERRPSPLDLPGDIVSNVAGKPDGHLEYDLNPPSSPDTFLSFALPMTDPIGVTTLKSTLADCAVASCPDRVATAWRQTLRRVDVVLPDREIDNAFYASLAYLLMAQSGAGLFSGPASEKATWVRDSAYGTQALATAGHADAAKLVLAVLRSGQQPDGRQAPIINPDDRPRLPLKNEWDAQGEYVYAVVECARITRDEAFLRAWYPSLRRAAECQRRLVTSTRVEALRHTPFYGLLPAGESAEDLYRADWHHYWDDFWAITGFHELADAATHLGIPDDAARYSLEEQTLRGNVLSDLA
jgi:hypothetical protein